MRAAIGRIFGISIHAPRRERRNIFKKVLGPIGFQSTLPEGSDAGGAPQIGISLTFQSTLPEGSDTAGASYHALSYQFQSTLPEGSDPPGRDGIHGKADFNPRSPKGATVILSLVTEYPRYFNPRSPKGATRSDERGRRAAGPISIHAPRRERRGRFNQ